MPVSTCFAGRDLRELSASLLNCGETNRNISDKDFMGIEKVCMLILIPTYKVDEINRNI
jgi:hypothetical protein